MIVVRGTKFIFRYLTLIHVVLTVSTVEIAVGGNISHGKYSSKPPTISPKSLQEFFANKLIAGNSGDFYLNLDGGHSVLKVEKIPTTGYSLIGKSVGFRRRILERQTRDSR